MRTKLLPIAQEGWKYLACLAALLLITLLFDFDFLSFITTIALLFLAYSFRNPERALPTFENASVISPVDGVVKSIEELVDSEYAYKVEVQSSYTDVSVLRSPFNASIRSLENYHGTRVSPSSKLFTDLNEKLEIVFLDASGNSIKVVHRLKQSFAPVSTDLILAQKIHQTARYGVMVNGVTTIYLPHNFRVSVNIGNELKAAESLMGYFS